VHRKKRGLKILSVKVRELVERKGQTTYKDVANELIRQLRENKKHRDDLAGLEETYDCDEDLSEESPEKRSSASKEPVQVLQKWEKNVRRRVYDALNVLYAAGVLRKEGKHVSCDPSILELTRQAADPEEVPLSDKKASNSDTKSHIEYLNQEIQQLQKLNERKRATLSENLKNFICYKHLIERNEKFQTTDSTLVRLPFVLLATKDSPENEIDLTYGPQCQTLSIAMKKPFTCIGDVDTLIKLGFSHVPMSWLQQQLPPGL